MDSARSKTDSSIFRTKAWVGAWLESWGHAPSVKLIDIGGSRQPLECFYTCRYTLKGCLPVRILAPAGVSSPGLNAPRSEHNDIDIAISVAGSAQDLLRELNKISWNQTYFGDMLAQPQTSELIAAAREHHGNHSVNQRQEFSYLVKAEKFEDYKINLSHNTRARYFNKRHRLQRLYNLERVEYGPSETEQALRHLNTFHITRWGAPCYSDRSIRFMTDFFTAIPKEGGRVNIEGLMLDGKLESLLIDATWNSVRYNIQSGFNTSHSSNVSIGAVHMGYAIESAIGSGLTYNFLAGAGKNTNYKEKISNLTNQLTSYTIDRPLMATLRRIHSKVSGLSDKSGF